jgi:hypothetical protein
MLRPLLLLVAVSACASSAPGVRASAPSVALHAPSARSDALASDAQNDHARLAPPFGGTAGVRRVSETLDAVSDANPGAVAAAERRD